tara:strand:- start:143 stop:394 length:252 start_codon:yes stop_codon:yes gene_type:complete
MVFTSTEIDKIIEYKSWNDTRKLDKLLEMDCSMYCNIGIDSTKAEKLEVRKSSRKIYTAIKKINLSMGTLFLTTMDSAREKEK